MTITFACAMAALGGSLVVAKLLKVVTFILVFCMLVFVHEFGHFIVAKRNDVLVHEFSIGMGPLIYGFKRGETFYALRAIPLGGYVKLEGEDLKSDHPRSLAKKKPWQKLLVLVAGATMNFLLAIVLLAGVYMYMGIPTTTLADVQTGKPAYVAGLQKGDKIVSVAGKSMKSWNDISNAISQTKGKLSMTFERQGQQKNAELTPELDAPNKRYIVGIVPVYEKSPLHATTYAIDRVGYFSKSILVFLGELPFKGAKAGDVAGPVGVFKIVGQAAQSGVVSVLFLTAILSINLGIFNLLPFPALDGGRIVFVLVEWVRGKPIDQEKEGLVHFVGFVILIGLMVLLVFNDLAAPLK